MRFFIIIFISLLLISCSTKDTQTSPKQRYSVENKGKAPEFIDPFISQNAQDLGHFAYKIKLDEQKYLKKLFATWFEKLPAINKKNTKTIFWGVLDLKNGYDANGTPRDKAWFKNLKDNADIKNYAKTAKKALTTTATLARIAPTNDPLFPDTKSAKQNNFDDLAESVLGAFSPVMISHFSKDKNWAFIRSDAFWCWVEAKNLLVLDDESADKFMKNDFGVFIKDGVVINGIPKDFISRIGGIFPYNKTAKNAFYFKGKIGESNYDFKVDFGVGSHFLVVNDKNLKALANELIGQKYGWGGMRFLRDCSLFTKDFFAVFGRWLPRNSQPQGQINGKISLEGLSNDEKKQVLKAKGLLLASLIVMPGHIMLYAGESEVIHNMWGVRTKENGRAIVGKTAITDLELGKGYENVDDKALLLSRIKGVNVVIDPKKIALEHAYNTQINSKIRFDDGYIMNYDESMMELVYPLYAPLSAPRNDAGRARNEQFFSHIYGRDKNEVSQNLVEVIWLKSKQNKKLLFNAKNGAAKALQRVSDDLDALSKKKPEILKYLDVDDTFTWRKIAKSDKLSPHSWGIAIDINVQNSSYWQWNKEYKNTLPKEVIDIFEENGFIWGGRWEHFDTMHFEYRPEYMMFERLKEG